MLQWINLDELQRTSSTTYGVILVWDSLVHRTDPDNQDVHRNGAWCLGILRYHTETDLLDTRKLNANQIIVVQTLVRPSTTFYHRLLIHTREKLKQKCLTRERELGKVQDNI